VRAIDMTNGYGIYNFAAGNYSGGMVIINNSQVAGSIMQNPEQGAQRFWSKPHTDSGAYRTLIPE
jgi:hypothetical protein